MNIPEAVLQLIAAFVNCNRSAAAGRRRQTNGVSLKLFYDGTTREIKYFYDGRPTAVARV